MLLFRLISEPNRIISVVANHYTELRRGPVRDAMNIINSNELYKTYIPKITQNGCYCPSTNSIMEFVAFPTSETAKSGKRDYLFINEATGIDYEIFSELQMRTKIRTWIDFNPTSQFWAHKYYLNNPDAEWIYSTHKANNFIPEKIHQEIENLKITNPEKYEVYGLGKCGKTEGLILQNWSLCEVLPEDFKWEVLGLDFGFTSDPTAITHIRYSDGQLWVKEVCYQRNMLNKDIADLIKKLGLQNLELICDSAEPKSIEELKRQGLYRARGAVKGKDSILSGLDTLKSLHINITRDSENLQNEFFKYKWKKDNLGNWTNTPEDKWNHSIKILC